WTISNVKSTIGLESQLQINGTSGPDTIRIVRNVNNTTLLDVFLNNTTTTPSLEVQLAVVQKILATGGAGADSLEIQSTGGIVNVPDGIEFQVVTGTTTGIQLVDTMFLNNSSVWRGVTGLFFIGDRVLVSLIYILVLLLGIEA